MSIRSVLLRLLLSIVLLLNGTATAVASVSMHMNHVEKSAATSQVTSIASPDGQDKMPCHDANEAKVAKAAHPDAGEHMHGSPDTGTPSPDCCESGACRCACIHHAQAAVGAAVVSVGLVEHTDSVRPMFSVHASPALPHLIRPPIG